MSAVGSTVVRARDGGLLVLPPSVGNIHVKIGPCSVAADGILVSCGTPDAVRALVGYGPTADAAVMALSTSVNGTAPGVVYVMPSSKTTPGAAGAVTVNRVGTSTGTVATTGSVPYDKYSIIVQIVGAGTLGAGRFQYSLDGGASYSNWTLIPTGGTYVVPGTGVSLVFTAGAGPAFFDVGDKFSFATTAPISSTAAITAAYQALLKDARTWGFSHVVQQPTAAAGLATLFDAVVVQADAFEAADRSFMAIIEAPIDTDANLVAAMAPKADTRIAVAAGELTYTIPDTGWLLSRSVGWQVAARAAAVPLKEDLSRVASGAIKNGGIVGQRDERQTPGLDIERFCVAYTYADTRTPGTFVTGQMFGAPGSDFGLMQYRRVIQEGVEIARGALRQFESDDSPVVPGTRQLDPSTVDHITGVVVSKLRAGLAGMVTDATFEIGDVSNIFSNQTLACKVGLIGLVYFKHIICDVAFVNPFATG